MPLTRKQFELGIDSTIEVWMRKVHSFLVQHKDEAFTEAELAEALDAFPTLPSRYSGGASEIVRQLRKSGFATALEKLVEMGAVEAGKIEGEVYYTIGGRPLEL